MRPDDRTVIVSSTYKDLEDCRQAVITACMEDGKVAECMEILTASPRTAVEESLTLVKRADIYVGIFAHRYGWVPKENNPEGISITEMEFNMAEALGHEMLLFLIDENIPVLPRDMENDPEKLTRLQRLKNRITKSEKFTFRRFTNPENLQHQVYRALEKMIPPERKVSLSSANPTPPPPLPPPPPNGVPGNDLAGAILDYLKRMIHETENISLMGLASKIGEASLPISEAYVELETQAVAPNRPRDPRSVTMQRSESRVLVTDLFTAAAEMNPPRRAVLVLGDPGAGKTTVTKRVFWDLATRSRGPEAYGLPVGTIPVLLKLQRFIPTAVLKDKRSIASFFSDPNVLIEFAKRETACEFLPPERQFPVAELWGKGRILWIFDGLDEIPNALARNLTLRLIGDAAKHRHDALHDRFLVTSRYAGIEGQIVQVPGCFARFDVKHLERDKRNELIRKFFQTVAPVYSHDPDRVAFQLSESLLSELETRENQPGIPDIVGNPLILIIICVVYWDLRRLPKSRAELYERCLEVFLLHWPTKRNEIDPEKAETLFNPQSARLILRSIAWWLHVRGERGGTVDEMSAHASAVLSKLDDPVLGVDGRQFILERMCRQCGILVHSGDKLEFLHLTFQEFLVADHATADRKMEVVAENLTEKWWHEPAHHALQLGSERDAAEFFRQLLIGGTLSDLLAKNDAGKFDPVELFYHFIRGTPQIPPAPFLQFLKSRRNDRMLRIVINGLLMRRSIPDEMATAVGKAACASREGEIWLNAIAILERAKLPVPGKLVKSQEKIFVDHRTGITFVRIPAGKFRMGTFGWKRWRAEERKFQHCQNEKPSHVVKISRSFYLGIHPVTNRQFAEFLSANPDVVAPHFWEDTKWNGENKPVVGVSWESAQLYCRWAGCRLPTEAEWEFACRAGSQYRFCFGSSDETLDDYAWYSKNSDNRTHDVGTKQPNKWGLYDMHGNVLEWCSDAIREYSEEPEEDPVGPMDTWPKRTLRGGAWSHGAVSCRSAFRLEYPRWRQLQDIGFRVIKLPE